VVDRPAKEGDTVTLDFEGFVDGKPFEGGKAENYALELGSHSFVPGFEEPSLA
jgi:trigger factor